MRGDVRTDTRTVDMGKREGAEQDRAESVDVRCYVRERSISTRLARRDGERHGGHRATREREARERS